MGKSWDRHITIDGKVGVFKDPPSDTEMLDWLEKHTKYYGDGWSCRNSTTGRGLRLHQTTTQEIKSLISTKVQPTVRKAITAAMQMQNERESNIAG